MAGLLTAIVGLLVSHTSGSLAATPSADPSETPGLTITQRIERVRTQLQEAESRDPLNERRSAEDLAQWYNWHDWQNGWDDWNNFNNWYNY